MKRLLFIFLDGVGLGSDDSGINPVVVAQTPLLDDLLGGKLTASLQERCEPDLVFKQLDATLGFSGLPQSATGQTALLTGKNGAEIMKGHYGPWPGPTLKKELDKGSLFSETLTQGKRAQFANVYPPGYFRALNAAKLKVNVPVYAARSAGLELARLERYEEGKAISVDLTGEYLQRYSPTLAKLSPYDMGKRLADLSRDASLTFFDFWPSDETGHRGSFAEAVTLLEKLDAFFKGVTENLRDVILLLTSDHGNLEDKSVKTHTRAAVPLLVLGPGAEAFEESSSLLDISPHIRKSIL